MDAYFMNEDMFDQVAKFPFIEIYPEIQHNINMNCGLCDRHIDDGFCRNCNIEIEYHCSRCEQVFDNPNFDCFDYCEYWQNDTHNQIIYQYENMQISHEILHAELYKVIVEKNLSTTTPMFAIEAIASYL